MKTIRTRSQKKAKRVSASIVSVLRWLAGPFIIILYTVSMMVEKLRF